MVKSFSELASEIGVTAQAIHNMKNRNEDIRVHCFKKGRSWQIDETGQQLILDRSLGKPKSQIVDTGIIDELNKYKDMVIALQGELLATKGMIEGAAAQKLLAEKLQEDYDSLKERLAKTEQELEEQKIENAKYEKSWFGFYRKK